MGVLLFISAQRELHAGIRWMQLIADHFRKSVWLNPDSASKYWKGGTAEALGAVFSMYQLTLDGLGEATAHLSRGGLGATEAAQAGVSTWIEGIQVHEGRMRHGRTHSPSQRRHPLSTLDQAASPSSQK